VPGPGVRERTSGEKPCPAVFVRNGSDLAVFDVFVDEEKPTGAGLFAASSGPCRLA
jgi:hypothetical protein